MQVSFRAATLDDLDTFKNIAQRVIRNNYTPFLGGDMVHDFIDSGNSDKEIDEGLKSCIVALNENQIVGFAISKEDVLHLIMVEVEHQSKGFGTALLRQIESEMFRKFETITLQSFKNNAPTNQFYLKNGWIITDEQRIDGLGIYVLIFKKVAI